MRKLIEVLKSPVTRHSTVDLPSGGQVSMTVREEKQH